MAFKKNWKWQINCHVFSYPAYRKIIEDFHGAGLFFCSVCHYLPAVFLFPHRPPNISNTLDLARTKGVYASFAFSLLVDLNQKAM